MAKPPKSVQNNAKKALKERKKWSESGAKPPTTEVGVARARDLSNGKDVSESTLNRMVSFLERHEKNYKPGERDSKGRLTKGTVSYLAWGGKSALSWAKKELNKKKKDK
jgi:hypothetical protein